MFSRDWFIVVVHVIATVFLFRILGFDSSSLYIVKHFLNYLLILFPILVFVSLVYQYSKKKYFDKGLLSQGKAVLITGCDYGFGHILCKQLDAKGFRVFACCQSEHGHGATDLKKLCSANLEVLTLDVAKNESVANVKDYVEKRLGNDGLWAIVNNATILKGLSLDFSDLQDFQECMEVNTMGAVRITKAFLPLLKKSKGRIVNLTSIVGRTTYPYMMPYIMSKYASVAFTEALRQELSVWGIRVISIEPEFFRAPCADIEQIEKHLEKAFSSLPKDILEEYGEVYLKNLKNAILWFGENASYKIHNVVTAMESAIGSKYPRDEYYPCRNNYFRVALFIYIRLPRALRDFILRVFLYCLFALVPKRKYDSS